MAHGAMPEAGVNPITALGALLREAPALERRLRRLCRRSPHLRPPTVTPTVAQAPLHGVAQSNVIPSTAQAILDVRLTPGPDADAVAKEIDLACRRAMDACPGATVEWQPINGFRLATRVERSEPLVRAMVRGCARRPAGAPRFGGVPGSTDGTILRMTLGIPIVTCGPGNRLIPHQVDEHVDVAELVDAARIYVASALNFLEMRERRRSTPAARSRRSPSSRRASATWRCAIPPATPPRWSCCRSGCSTFVALFDGDARRRRHPGAMMRPRAA